MNEENSGTHHSLQRVILAERRGMSRDRLGAMLKHVALPRSAGHPAAPRAGAGSLQRHGSDAGQRRGRPRLALCRRLHRPARPPRGLQKSRRPAAARRRPQGIHRRVGRCHQNHRVVRLQSPPAGRHQPRGGAGLGFLGPCRDVGHIAGAPALRLRLTGTERRSVWRLNIILLPHITMDDCTGGRAGRGC